MQNLKTITADGFAVNFLLSNVNGYFGDCETECEKLLQNLSGEILLFSYDKGYFSLGKRIKEFLLASGKSVSCFCFDVECNLQLSVKKILSETPNYACVIVIDDCVLAKIVKGLVCERAQFLYLPTDFEFGCFLCDENSKNGTLIFDKTIYLNLKKNKLLNGIKSVLAKRLVYIEMLVYELIAGVIDKNEAFFAFESGQGEVFEYFKKPNVKNLVLAQFLCSVAVRRLPIDYNPVHCAVIAQKLQFGADLCDLEYAFYKLILKIYSLYFNNKIDFTARLPNTLSENDMLTKIGLTPCEILPDFLYDNERLKSMRNIINGSENLKSKTLEQLMQTDSFKQTFKKIYAGRKYTVEHYGEKERAKSILLSVRINEKLSALKVVWADGVLQYFN